MGSKCSNSELLIRIDERVRVMQKDLSQINKNFGNHIQEDLKAFQNINEKLIILQNHNQRIRILERRGVGYRVGSWVNSFITGVLGFRK